LKEDEKEDIQIKLDAVIGEISALERQRNHLEKCLIEASDSFEEKFRTWWDSGDKEHSRWIIERGTPLRDYYNERFDMDRHRTYDLCEDLADDLLFILDPEEYEADVKENPGWAIDEDRKETLLAVAKQKMEENIGSFTCDW